MQSRALNAYTTVVIVAGITALVANIASGFGSLDPLNDPAFLLFAACIILGEFFPIRFSTHPGEVAISTTFIFAIIASYGIAPAVAMQAFASSLADLNSRKPPRRILFNVAQYTLAWTAAGLVFRSLEHSGPTSFTLHELGVIALAAFVFFALNAVLVRTAVALGEGIRIREHLRRDLGFTAWTTGMLMGISPAVTAVQQIDLVLVVLLMLPVLAVHRAATESARNAHLATHDGLTGLPNRVLLQRRIASEIERSGPDDLVAVGIMDLDRFKEVNDTLGHHYGDLLLCEVGPRVARVIGDRGLVARLGGDEFAFVLRLRRADGGAALAAGRDIVQSLRTPFVIGGITLDAVASIGVALYPDQAGDVETLMQHADVAMYRAKEAHSGVELYSADHDHNNLTTLAMAGDLRRAIENDELEVHYQPTIDLHTGAVSGVEALVRWFDPERGAVSPADFVPLAERTGLIHPLTNFVLHTALDQCKAWKEAGHDIRVAVNMSAHTLIDTGLPTEIQEMLISRGLTGENLLLEITESVLMTDPTRSTAVLRRLGRYGIEAAVDDFGTGYSSLNYLKRLPVDEVKIDQSFVRTMATDQSDAVIVRAITELGHSLGLRVVAEGVEDEMTLDQLRRFGCDVAQGYHLGRPMPASDLTPRLNTTWAPPFVVDVAGPGAPSRRLGLA